MDCQADISFLKKEYDEQNRTDKNTADCMCVKINIILSVIHEAVIILIRLEEKTKELARYIKARFSTLFLPKMRITKEQPTEYIP